jgi:hypothetical protein
MASFFGKRHAPSFQLRFNGMGLTHGKAAAQGDPRNGEYTPLVRIVQGELIAAP